MMIDWRKLETFISDTMRDNREDSWSKRVEILSKKLADEMNGQTNRFVKSGGCVAQARSAADEDAHKHAGRDAVVHSPRRPGV